MHKAESNALNKVNCLYKSLCPNCSNNLLQSREETYSNLCRMCNTLVCDGCIETSECIKCKKLACNVHSIICHVCKKRCCKEKACIADFHICQSCQQTFCNEHFDNHKKYNQSDPYKVKCNSLMCKIALGIGADGITKFASYLENMCLLKELRLRNSVTQKTTIWVMQEP